MISVRPLRSDEWQAYRDVRLRALRDAPDAFGSTYEAEAGRADAAWAARVAACADDDGGVAGRDRAFVACDGDQSVCGLVWCKLSAADAGVADIFQMWVDPAVRGRGVGRALLGEAIGWARGRGALCVRLGVTAVDGPALRLYRSLGFRRAGPLEPLREGSALRVQPMALQLAPCARPGLGAL